MSVGSIGPPVVGALATRALGDNKTPSTNPSTARTAFENYMKMTPAERMREAVLKRLGLTEDQLAKMPPEERKAAEKQIADVIKQDVEEHIRRGEKVGVLADLTV